jgi:hypothetical protein
MIGKQVPRMQTPEKPAFETPFEWIGGEARVKALVERFYDLMDLEPNYSALRATHAGPLDNARQKTFWFLCGWMGGPQHYTERFGHPMLRMRHMPQQTGGGSMRAPQYLVFSDRRLDAQQGRLGQGESIAPESIANKCP